VFWMVPLTLFWYSPEEVIKQLEKKVIELLEESAFANSKGNLQLVQYKLSLRI
jgi:hypothetical protein